jgi:DNA-binding XRE family transcriptional regulator
MTATLKKPKDGRRVSPDMGRPPKDPDTSTYRGRFAAKLRQQRVEKGVTVEKAAKAAGVSVSTWSYWETGERAITLDALPDIARAVKSKPVELLPDK